MRVLIKLSNENLYEGLAHQVDCRGLIVLKSEDYKAIRINKALAQVQLSAQQSSTDIN